MKNLKLDAENDNSRKADETQDLKSTPKLREGNTAPVQSETERILNEKIMKLTMTIKAEYPELSKYVDEMTITLPDEEHPDITIKKLMQYHDSLKALLRGYKIEHPANSK